MKRRASYRAAWFRYDAFVVRALREFVEGRLRGLVRQGDRVLDVGCGEQPTRRLVEQLGARYVGVDLSHNDARTVTVLAAAETLPFADASFSVVVLTEVLEHVRQPSRALHECGRVLRAGGVAVITVPFLYPLHEEPHDFLRPTPHLLRRLCDEAGLDVVALQPLGTSLEAAVTLIDHAWPTRGTVARWGRLSSRLLTFGVVRVVEALVAPDPGQSGPLGHGIVARRRPR